MSDRASVEVRTATLDDRAAVAALRRAWTEENAGATIDDPTFLARFDEWLAREHDQRVTWLGLVGGAPVAMLNLLVFTRMPAPRPPGSTRATQWGYLANFYVRPEQRDVGIGTAMLGACTAYADEHGFARIVLSPTTGSVPLYARHGFAPATSLMVRQP
ncbi:GNAT family N-acetyltransferase [Nocardioides bigeumensis]|uniref:N-acetyltransferase domain-containing protein n=1 Tax=Nocardioides bigeumensis TaxID=433657 RepID=A0ABN2XRY0_9ACTN